MKKEINDYEFTVLMRGLRDVFKTLMFLVVLIILTTTCWNLWEWSNAKVAQETFKRKECAVHYYALCDDYDKLLELVMKDASIADNNISNFKERDIINE